MSEAGGTEAKISLGKTAVEHGRAVAPSDAINLSKVVTDKVLLEKLEKYGTINTANLWLPVAFAQIIGHFGETDLLHTLARHLSTKSSPFRPWYEVHHDYQIKVDSESSDCCKAMFSVDMKLPAGSLSSSASLVLPLEQFSDWNEEKVEKIRDSLLASVVGMRCQTSPTNLGEKDLCKPVKVPLVTEMLALLEKPTKGSLDLRLSEVIIRRYGLLSGRVDTLDHIAKDVDTSKDISRERVRQLEEKALKLIHSRKRVRRELSSCFNAFKSQIQLWLSAHNHVGHVQEIVESEVVKQTTAYLVLTFFLEYRLKLGTTVYLDRFHREGHPLLEYVKKMSGSAGVSLPLDTHHIPFGKHVMRGKVFEEHPRQGSQV